MVSEGEFIAKPLERSLITSFKWSRGHAIYIGSGTICSDDEFAKSKATSGNIGANRRYCRELVHWLLEEDPGLLAAKFEKDDPQ